MLALKVKREMERYNHLNAEFQRIAWKDKKDFLSEVLEIAKKQRTTIQWERLEISSRKLEIPREIFMQDGTRGQKWYRPNRSRRY